MSRFIILLAAVLAMIITRFGDAYDSAYIFPTLKATDEFNITRPSTLQKVGGRDGSFDANGDSAAPLMVGEIRKSFSLSATTYAGLETALDALKTATLGDGRSKVWGVLRDGLTLRWAWAKIVSAEYSEARDHSNLTLPVIIQIYLPIVEWAGNSSVVSVELSRDEALPLVTWGYPPSVGTNIVSESFSGTITLSGTAGNVDFSESFTTAYSSAGIDDLVFASSGLFLQTNMDLSNGHVTIAISDADYSGGVITLDGTYRVNSSLTLTNASLTGTATNAGNLPAAPIITLTNGSNSATGFTLTNAANGHTFTYTGTIDGSDVIIVDCRKLAVTLNGTNAYDNLTYGATQLSWFNLEPGDNDLTLTLAGSTGTKTLVVEWYDTYA